MKKIAVKFWLSFIVQSLVNVFINYCVVNYFSITCLDRVVYNISVSLAFSDVRLRQLISQ